MNEINTRSIKLCSSICIFFLAGHAPPRLRKAALSASTYHDYYYFFFGTRALLPHFPLSIPSTSPIPTHRDPMRAPQHRRSTFPGSGEWNRSRSSSTGSGIGGNGGSGSSSSGGASPVHREAKADAAVAILASAVYLWDFFLSSDAHASLGLARDTNAYVTLRELLVEGGVGTAGTAGGGEGGGAMTAAAKIAAFGGTDVADAGVDMAVSVGKALLDMQRQVLRKVRFGTVGGAVLQRGLF